jgi:hypothetical protein
MTSSSNAGSAGCIQDDKCGIKCVHEELTRVLNVPNDDENTEEIFMNPNYWIILYAWVLGSTAMNGVTTFQDAIATQIVQDHESGETFGHQRLWASVGWGSSALLVGYLVDLASADSLLFNYAPAFTVMAIAWMIDAFIVKKLPVCSNTPFI